MCLDRYDNEEELFSKFFSPNCFFTDKFMPTFLVPKLTLWQVWEVWIESAFLEINILHSLQICQGNQTTKLHNKISKIRIWESCYCWGKNEVQWRSFSNRILPYFPLSVRASVTGVTSHISHIYKGINTMLIILGPTKPYIFWMKIILAIFLAKTRPDQTSPPPWPTWPLILTLNYKNTIGDGGSTAL